MATANQIILLRESLLPTPKCIGQERVPGRAEDHKLLFKLEINVGLIIGNKIYYKKAAGLLSN